MILIESVLCLQVKRNITSSTWTLIRGPELSTLLPCSDNEAWRRHNGEKLFHEVLSKHFVDESFKNYPTYLVKSSKYKECRNLFHLTLTKKRNKIFAYEKPLYQLQNITQHNQKDILFVQKHRNL